MKKLLLFFSLISFISCSKTYNEQGQLITTPPVVVLTAYPVDLNFTIEPDCNIVYDTLGNYLPLFEKVIYLFARCNGTIGGNNIFLSGYISQSYLYFYNTYSPANVTINELNTNNKIELAILDFNMFLLPYNNGAATFSGTCSPYSGSEKYFNVRRGNTTLSITGIADAFSHAGSFRIQGTLYY